MKKNCKDEKIKERNKEDSIVNIDVNVDIVLIY